MTQVQAVAVRASAPIRVVRSFIEANYFYLISTFLIVLGCYRLVRSALITGVEFNRTLCSLGVLQGYEILVIVTALLIVRRFGALNDAFSLFVIELALLLDPTFFSNSFITMYSGHSASANAIMMLLVPFKLIVLQWIVGVHPGHRYNAGFLLAALSVYAAAWPLAYYNPPLTRYGWYYALGVQVMLIAFVLPPWRSILPPRLEATGFLTPRQGLWLPVFMVLIPVAAAASHFVESARIHDLLFFPANAAPLALAIAVLIIANTPRESRYHHRIYWIDALACAALLLSSRMINSPNSTDLLVTRGHEPRLYMSSWPLAMGAGLIFATYALAYRSIWRRECIRRLASLASLGLCYLVIRSGIPQRIVGAIFGGFTAGASYLDSHPTQLLIGLWVLSAVLAWKLRNYATWLASGLFLIFIGFTHMKSEHVTLAELVEAVCILAILLSHRFSPDTERGQRYFAAFVVAAIALLRFRADPCAVTGLIVFSQVGVLVVAGLRLRLTGYLLLGLLQSVAMLAIAGTSIRLHVHPAIGAIVSGLVFFALGVAVTFSKHRILDGLSRLDSTWRIHTPGIPADAQLSQQENEKPQ